jgi:ethanolamine utilization cobalamin adenosyltransferase
MVTLFPIIVLANVGAAFMMLAGCVLFVYVLMRKAHMEKQLQKQQQRESTIISEMPRLARTPKTWQTSDHSVEMADMARDINGQLTTKMIVLEQLIADSQKQIERMEELLERIEAEKRNQ